MTSKSIETDDTLESILTEPQLMKQFQFTKVLLSHLRNYEKLPFLRVNRSVRLYSERDIVEWLNSRRTVMEPRK